MPNHSALLQCESLLTRWFLVFGEPGKLLIYQEKNFECAVFANLYTKWRVRKTRTSYNTASKGSCEFLQQTPKMGVQKALNYENLEL